MCSPDPSEKRWRFALACILLFTLTGCARSAPKETSQAKPAAESPSAQGPDAAPLPPELAAPAFNSSRAMEYVKEMVAFGPRPLGGGGHKKTENYILAHLKGDDVERDDFEITPSEGRFPVHNIIAKYPGTKAGLIVIASHYDTNWPLRNTNYVGANDGGSSSAVLLEIANQLRGKKRDGYSVWLVWDDAEESMKLPWDDPESLYGVRHLAEKWQADGTLKKIKAFLLEDMVGETDVSIVRESNSTPWLEDLIGQAAARVGYQSHFFAIEMGITDDHLPFLQRGVPSADLIDMPYGYDDVFHHTVQDTLDKLSPKSLGIVGTVTLETLRMLDQR